MNGPRGEPPIELLLSIGHPDAEAGNLDVAVRIAPDTQVGGLSVALERYCESAQGTGEYDRDRDRDAPPDLHCARVGRLDPGERVVDSGLRSGDVVALVADARFAASPFERVRTREPTLDGSVVDLVVRAGPQAGTHVSLLPGRYLLGRDPACEIVLDDPSLSRRHLAVKVGFGTVEIEDLGSLNGSTVEGRTLRGTTRLDIEESPQVELGRSVITLTRARRPASAVDMGGDGLISFNRQLRLVEPCRPPRMRLEAAPPDMGRTKLQIGAALVPLLLGGASAAIFRQPALLLSMLLGPATLVWSYVSESRHGRRLFQQSMARYTKGLAALADELERATRRECAARRAAAPDAAELTARALELRPELWERRPIDADFLALRVGVADLPPEYAIDTPTGNDTALPDQARQLLDAYGAIPSIPVTINLREVGSLGLSGPELRVDGLGLWLALQATVLHSPRELALAAAIDPDQHERWDWLKWTPHTRAPAHPLNGPRLACDGTTTGDLLRRVRELVSTRHHEHGGHHAQDTPATPALLLILGEDLVEERVMAGEILEFGPAVGVYTIWLGHVQRGLPGECRAVALLDCEIARLELIQARGAERTPDVTIDAVAPSLALEVARALAAVRDTGIANVDAHPPEPFAPERAPRGESTSEDVGATDHPPAVTVSPFSWWHAFATATGSHLDGMDPMKDTQSLYD